MPTTETRLWRLLERHFPNRTAADIMEKLQEEYDELVEAIAESGAYSDEATYEAIDCIVVLVNYLLLVNPGFDLAEALADRVTTLENRWG